MVKAKSVPLVKKVGDTERETITKMWHAVRIYRARKYTRKHYARRSLLVPRYSKGDHENARTALRDQYFFWWTLIRGRRRPYKARQQWGDLTKNAASRFIVLKGKKK